MSAATSAVELLAPEAIRLRIATMRGQRVILDADLAALFGAEAKRFNEVVMRNLGKFPADFMFSLTAEEWAALRSQFATLNAAGTGRGQHRKYLPYAFTEHGAIMAATFLSSQPQRATFADGTFATQLVNNLGNVASYTNEVNTTTRFEFDLMGRVSRIVYPTGDDEPYCDTNQYFLQSTSPERGLDAGHWKQTVITCNAWTERWFDAFWRVRLERKHDFSNPGGTATTVETRYDGGGRKAFQSYPQREISWVNTGVSGASFEYDALDRVRYERADSELGPATVVTETRYEAGFTKRVINPRGFHTVYAYQAFDEPAEENIKAISLPENVGVSIARDVFGKALNISRAGPGPTGHVSVTRSYGYDGFQRLCKTVEPETGATVQGYDASGNLAWRASGQAAHAGCELSQQPGSAVISFEHDLRNRLARTRFGDGQPEVRRTYWADGALKTVESSSFHWSYAFNNRRLLKSEAFSVPGQTPGSGWHFTRHIDRHGNVARLSDYWGTMLYEPTALGQPTQISGYVSQVSYHPGGMVANYRLANGIWRSVGLNTRGLPSNWEDHGVFNDAYSYDANGNVTGIQDNPGTAPPSAPPSPTPPPYVPPPPPPYDPPPPGCDDCHPQRIALQGRAGENTRYMAYDGLDRLIAANGPWGNGIFNYDAVDNLVYSQVGGRTLHHNIHAATNRLQSLSGSQYVGMEYDPNGNLRWRGAQRYDFDLANRMRAVPGVVNYYDYDGHGRRSWVVWPDGKTQLNAYAFGNASGSTGTLLFSAHSTKGATRYVYLGGKLIAEDNNVTGVRFSHTDALGSPVARTNGAGAVIERTRYEPYGAAWAGSTNPVGIGFTGHVNDPDTGLVYMQQRYYDPIAGRFLSVDPITTDSNTGGFFNRYTYALNNPFKFVDPTGMAPDCSAIGGSTCNSTGSLSGGADAVGTAAAATTRMTSSAMTGGYSDKTIQAAESGDGVAAAVYTLAGTAVGVTNVLTIGNGSRILGLFGLAAKGPVVIGETMARVELAAAKIPGAKILNDMPDFKAMGMSAEQVTSAMMQHNRKWILEQLRSGRQIIDIGLDPNRAIPSIFYQMEKNMLKNLDKLQNSGH